MRIVADIHVHSKYARGTSPRCDIEGLSEGAKIKGIDVIATGDFTHPLYFQEIKTAFRDSETGLFDYKGVKFILSTEISVIYPGKEKTNKMHHIVLSPSLEVAEQVNDILAKIGNLKADGRPILGISSAGLADQLFSISDDIMVIPAHVWTPWFSIFGSKSGVDSVEQAFEEHAGKIYALETGLSSDPAMNWLVSSLDRYTLVSNSDAHSLAKLGREANVFDLPEITYQSITNAIKTRKGFQKTYEFYPEEGKYHYDGHRKCHVLLSPWESKARNDICPICRKKLTIGVMHRVADLADRKPGYRPANAISFDYIVPLTTIISKTLKKAEISIAVAEEYSKLIRYFGSEFAVFEADNETLKLATTPEIALSIIRVKSGKIRWIPGYDGVFGNLVLDDNRKKETIDKKQKSLTEF
ncbi:DNA helicase UvrD [Candidatus Micrarchaeota archaeon]|nr:DNA helicase UvrD [Candidatus Micrarchaeota archaeon]